MWKLTLTENIGETVKAGLLSQWEMLSPQKTKDSSPFEHPVRCGQIIQPVQHSLFCGTESM